MHQKFFAVLLPILFIILLPIIIASSMDKEGESTVNWQDQFGYKNKDAALKAARNGNMKEGKFTKLIQNKKANVKVSGLKENAVKNNINAIKEIGKQRELGKDQIAAVEDKSKLGDLGNYDPTAMQQAIQDEYPNADVEPADGMKLTDDGKLTYQWATMIPPPCNKPSRTSTRTLM